MVADCEEGPQAIRESAIVQNAMRMANASTATGAPAGGESIAYCAGRAGGSGENVSDAPSVSTIVPPA